MRELQREDFTGLQKAPLEYLEYWLHMHVRKLSKARERTTRKVPRCSYKAKNSACFHQPDCKSYYSRSIGQSASRDLASRVENNFS